MDDLFTLMNEITFFVFMLEFLLSSLFESHFIGSFFFWVDLISMLSCIPDVQIIWNPLVQLVGGGQIDPNDVGQSKEVQRTGIATGASST